MQERFRDYEHLIRMAALFAGGLLAFVVLRSVLVADDFGVYGHYRATALAANRAREVVYAGRGTCEVCHDDIVEARAGSRHSTVGCEACHGPLSAHAEDPEALAPILPDPSICVVCHTENVAKPEGYPQVAPQEHSGGEPCTECHLPHHPEIS